MMYIAADKERCVVLGTYIVENRTTVRKTAARYGISKSTVHKDVTETLRHVNVTLYEEVKKVLEQNKSERHLRGGEATRQRHLSRRLANAAPGGTGHTVNSAPAVQAEPDHRQG